MNIRVEINDVVLDGIRLAENQSRPLEQALMRELMHLTTIQLSGSHPSRCVTILKERLSPTVEHSPCNVASSLAQSINRSLEDQSTN